MKRNVVAVASWTIAIIIKGMLCEPGLRAPFETQTGLSVFKRESNLTKGQNRLQPLRRSK
jgi:hypothetical protein